MTFPCRTSNPFATCWTNPQAMQYLAADRATPADLVRRLRDNGWRGQIVGPHGAGKSTLLAALCQVVQIGDRKWVQVNLHRRRTKEGWRAFRSTRLDKQTLLVVDGFEQLGILARKRISWQCQRRGAGLLVTAHQSVGLPMLVELQPCPTLALHVFRYLTRGVDTPVTEGDVLHAFNACNGNIREMLMNLYDLHERRIRTAPVANIHSPSAVSMAERPDA